MFSQRIRHVMERRKLLQSGPETTVAQAAKLMAKKNVGAVMVVEARLLVGIFTERDNTGAHVRHQNVYGTTAGACTTCHEGAGDETPYHARGTINLRIGTTYWAAGAWGSYSQGDHKGAGGSDGNCSNTTCHGGPTKIWNAITTTHQCTKCHGNDWTTTTYTLYKAAPGADQTGHDNCASTGAYSGRVSNNPVVGAHDAHLRAQVARRDDLAGRPPPSLRRRSDGSYAYRGPGPLLCRKGK